MASDEEEVELSRAFAIRDHEARNYGELDFLIGEIIEDVKFGDDQSSGRSLRAGRTGAFLNDFVQEINRFDPDTGQLRWNIRAEVIFNHSKKEASELDVRVGDILIVKETSLDDWWLGELDGHGVVGYFPKNYVRILNNEDDAKDHEDEEGRVQDMISQVVSSYANESYSVLSALKKHHDSQKQAIMIEVKRFRDEEQRKYSLHVERLLKDLRDRDEDIKRLKFDNANLKAKLSSLPSESSPSSLIRPMTPKSLPRDRSRSMAAPPLPSTSTPIRTMHTTPKPQPIKPVWSFPVPRFDRAEVTKTPIPDSVANIEFEIEDVKPNLANVEIKNYPDSSNHIRTGEGDSPASDAKDAKLIIDKENFDEKKNFWNKFQK